jgi:hypothetical protein
MQQVWITVPISGNYMQKDADQVMRFNQPNSFN